MSNTDTTLWVKEHHKDLWHRSGDHDGQTVLCGKTIPGAPSVARVFDDWEPEPSERCPRCQEILMARKPAVRQPDEITHKSNGWDGQNLCEQPGGTSVHV